MPERKCGDKARAVVGTGNRLTKKISGERRKGKRGRGRKERMWNSILLRDLKDNHGTGQCKATQKITEICEAEGWCYVLFAADTLSAVCICNFDAPKKVRGK